MKKILLLLVLGGLSFSLFFYVYIAKTPIDGYPYYYRNRLGMIYEDVSTGCLDICIFPELKRLDVDIRTFEVLREKNGLSSPYAKDLYSVYYEAEIIKDADPGSFELLYASLAKDKNTYYMYGIKIEEFIREIDPNVSFSGEDKIKMVEFKPPFFMKVSDSGAEYVVYYTGEKRVEKVK